MKALRVGLLVLLAVLLPLRGAMAAAMGCPPAAVGLSGEMPAAAHSGHADGRPGATERGHDRGEHDLGEHDRGMHGHGAHDHGLHSQGTHDHGVPDHGLTVHADDASAADPDTCNLCAAFCALTPLVDSRPPSLPAFDAAATRFPAWSAPPPRFVSGGQDRPPRNL